MSPIGGVGINLALQDAVATANLLGSILISRAPTLAELATVERRRRFPTRATQWLQVMIQNRVISHVLASDRPLTPPWPLKLVRRWPILRRLPARIIGVGFRPEHIQTPDVRMT
jgi:2-polyprenyl-6-methoxyphenol hydroxylase-like FAD-dependent oxidoreductase